MHCLNNSQHLSHRPPPLSTVAADCKTWRETYHSPGCLLRTTAGAGSTMKTKGGRKNHKESPSTQHRPDLHLQPLVGSVCPILNLSATNGLAAVMEHALPKSSLTDLCQREIGPKAGWKHCNTVVNGKVLPALIMLVSSPDAATLQLSAFFEPEKSTIIVAVWMLPEALAECCRQSVLHCRVLFHASAHGGKSSTSMPSTWCVPVHCWQLANLSSLFLKCTYAPLTWGPISCQDCMEHNHSTSIN